MGHCPKRWEGVQAGSQIFHNVQMGHIGVGGRGPDGHAPNAEHKILCKSTSFLPEFIQCTSFLPSPHCGKCEVYTPVFVESCTKWSSRIPICRLKLNYLKGLMYLYNKSSMLVQLYQSVDVM